MDDDRHAARHAYHFRIAQPARSGKQHLVAGIEQRVQRPDQGLLGPRGHNDLRRLIVDALLLIVPGDRRAQLGYPGSRGVNRPAGIDGSLARPADMRRGGKIRFACRQADDILPLLALFSRQGVQAQRGRGGDIPANR